MGASPTREGASFRVWAPTAAIVELEICGQPRGYYPMQPLGDGTWTAAIAGLGPGTLYRYRLNGQDSYPDPYSKSQPQGVHGPSEVVDPEAYTWRDKGWKGLEAKGLVIYECHVGTFTGPGTFDSLIDQLDRLAGLGVRAIELMPLAEFSGTRNWGYDGVYLYAPTRNYGGVDALKRLVDAAHNKGLGVIMDVVYNHMGPEGNYISQFSPYYFSSKYKTAWGDAINYDGPESQWVRKFVIDNACYWVNEYHVDGLRLDAPFAIHDSSRSHILQDLTTELRNSVSPGRGVVLIAESSENDVRYLLPSTKGGHGFDAVWADDFHHSIRRYLAGDNEGYYRDYQGTLEEVARTINQGFLYEGEWSPFWGRIRGTPARDQSAQGFQYSLQNHDQVGNRAFGDRLHYTIDLDRYRAASMVLLLLPYTPLLFMGQEFVASSPFQYFTDHSPDLGRLVTEGRRKEFADYSAFDDLDSLEKIPDPQAKETFLRSKLKLEEASISPGAQISALYRELLRLRRSDPVLSKQDRHAMQARAIGNDILAVHFHAEEGDRLMLANFGEETSLSASEWAWDSTAGLHILLDTNESRFGGRGERPALDGDTLRLPAHCAVFMRSKET